ncbi:MAG: hypothetical protein QOG54_459 [Actinomycetota bacterium]|jgi:hypothetical protein|nr:hypothetical protein [Actinomycetota bacterium]
MAYRNGAVALGRATSNVLSNQLPELVRLAYLFSGDHDRAGQLAGAALGHALARPWSARDPEGTHSRALQRLAKRAPRKTKGASNEDDQLWRAYLALPRRRRVVLALSVAKDLDARSISEVVGCSPGGAESLLAHGTSDLERVSGEPSAQLGIRLREVFDAKLEAISKLPLGPAPSPWKWRIFALVALAFLAGIASVSVPRLLDRSRTEAGPIDTPAIDRQGSQRVRLPSAFPRIGPKIPIADGSVSGVAAWTVEAYRAENDLVCFELRAGTTYGDRHCVSSTLSTAHAFASPDRAHSLTFLYGNVEARVARVDLVEPGVKGRRLDLVKVPAALKTGPGNMFAGFVAGYLLPLASKEDAEFQNYELADLSLLGRSSSGRPLVRYELLLGRPPT